MTRLLKERSVARFVVAPSGYGKTSLAIDYAETVFAWVHTFFVNCQSPCFIRDLDDESIADACSNLDPDARLVVFDALPSLDPARAERLSREIDVLLASGCEVLVTCTPASYSYGQLQADQVRLGSRDLLLTDAELDAARSLDERSRVPSSQMSPACRVPALAWGSGPDSNIAFLKGCFQEAMPADLALLMASMFVLRRGPSSCLSSLGQVDAEAMRELLDPYPHLGIDGEGRFEAPSIAVDEIAQGIKGALGAIVEASSFTGRSELVRSWADLLLGTCADADRACDCVRVMCPRQDRAAWIAAHVAELLDAGCFCSAYRLVKSMSTKAADTSLRDKARAHLLEAACCAMLGDRASASASARRFAFDEAVDEGCRLYGLLVIAAYGQEAQRIRAEECLAELSPDPIAALRDAAPLVEGVAARAHVPSAQLADADALVSLWRARGTGAAKLGELWRALSASGVGDMVLCIAALQYFEAVRAQEEESGGMPVEVDKADAVAVERFVRLRLDADDGLSSSFFAVKAGIAMEQAHVAGMKFADGPLPTSVLIALRQAEMSLLRQKQQFVKAIGEEKARQTGWPSAPSAPSAAQQFELVAQTPRNVPILQVKMFGCFEVSIGGVLLDPKLFRRQNVRSMFVLLAIHQGREVSRDVISSAIWPKSPIEVARKNFYSVWSQLRRNLTLPDGSCPYLVRHQYGCSLEQRYVQSDIARLVQICRELMFGRPDVEEWSEIYTELDRDFHGELMPSEANNPVVLNARAEYRTRLVDALVSATQRIVDAGNPQCGIWFSRMAIEYDKVREDAYVALMRAQVASNQRTAAIMTFLKCQHVLAEELGVDPSPETMALYESLLD